MKTLSVCLLCILSLVQLAVAQDRPVAPVAAPTTAPATAPLPKQDPAVAAPKYDPKTGGPSTRFTAMHDQFLARAKEGNVDLLFLGDSITQGWGGNGKDVWQQHYAKYNVANFGIGGDQTQHVLWRIRNGELDGVNPKVIVVQAGTNNVGTQPGDDAKVAEVTRGLKAILDSCREKAPAATIVLTAIFPRNDNPAVMPTINRINAHLAALADGAKVRFLNVNDKLADRDGKLLEGMTGDKLHPTVKGYQVWADALKPIVTELLGPPADEDLAPPPTGDPSITAGAGAPAGR